MSDEQGKPPKRANDEIVHIVLDYWDGPREGVANYHGTPHYFKALFDEQKDEWSDVFVLSPLDPDTYNLMLEHNRIWRRWKEAFDTGATTLDTHPALPDDTKRNQELTGIIERRLQSNKTASIEVKGRFEANDRTKRTSDREWRVRWLAHQVEQENS